MLLASLIKGPSIAGQQEIATEALLRIEPGASAGITGVARQLPNSCKIVLVRVFGVIRSPGSKCTSRLSFAILTVCGEMLDVNLHATNLVVVKAWCLKARRLKLPSSSRFTRASRLRLKAAVSPSASSQAGSEHAAILFEIGAQ